MQQLPDRVVYLFGPFRLDPAGRRLLRDGEPVGLTAKVFDVLAALVEAQGAVVERDALMDRVWPATAVIDANLTQTVSVLRKALGDTAAEHRYIATVPGRGYQFTAPVETVRLAEALVRGHCVRRHGCGDGRGEGAVRRGDGRRGRVASRRRAPPGENPALERDPRSAGGRADDRRGRGGHPDGASGRRGTGTNGRAPSPMLIARWPCCRSRC